MYLKRVQIIWQLGNAPRRNVLGSLMGLMEQVQTVCWMVMMMMMMRLDGSVCV